MATHPSVQKLLEELGSAVTRGDVRAVSALWEVPALVLMDDGGAVLVSQRSEIEGFMNHAVERYRSRGIVATRPESVKVEDLSPGIVAVDVRWPGLDQAGVEKGSERSYYLIQRAEAGAWRIRVALTRAS